MSTYERLLESGALSESRALALLNPGAGLRAYVSHRRRPIARVLDGQCRRALLQKQATETPLLQNSDTRCIEY